MNATLRIRDRRVAEPTYASLRGAKAEVVRVEREEREIHPKPPFETGTMLQMATRRLRLSSERVMRLAQDLFEGGLITYHRTDSTRVSEEGKRVARDYIRANFDPEDYSPRTWEPEAEHVEGAHECIRPTRPADTEELRTMVREGAIRTTVTLTSHHLRLYDLIFRRFVASQMKPAKVLYQEAVLEVEVKGVPVAELELSGVLEVLEPGFTKALTEYDLPAYGIRETPKLEEGNRLEIGDVEVLERHETYPYDQSELVEDMRERGLGRPSTYAQIVEKLFRRGYVYEVPRRRWIFPTTRGEAVYEYLSTHYEQFVSEETTRDLEERMDAVALGEAEYQEEMEKLYLKLSEAVEMPDPEA
ncbi:DNA topoisomerase [Methanopyrus sp.]